MITMQVKPLKGPLGAEVSGIDLSHKLGKRTQQKIQDLLREHEVLIFRKQKLTKEQYLGFGKIFGNPSVSRAPHKHQEYPQISIISNTKEGDKVPAFYWHSDGHYGPRAYRFVMLYSITVPKKGGETLYTNLRLAYDTLSDSAKKAINHKHVLYENVNEGKAPVSHPLVVKNTKNKRKALYVMPGGAITIDGMDKKAGMKLINKLIAHATQSKFTYQHKWRKGDVVIWDNLATLHAATLVPKTPRLLYRLHIY